MKEEEKARVHTPPTQYTILSQCICFLKVKDLLLLQLELSIPRTHPDLSQTPKSKNLLTDSDSHSIVLVVGRDPSLCQSWKPGERKGGRERMGTGNRDKQPETETSV